MYLGLCGVAGTVEIPIPTKFTYLHVGHKLCCTRTHKKSTFSLLGLTELAIVP